MSALIDYIDTKWSSYAGQQHHECMKCRDEDVKTTDLFKMMEHVMGCGVLDLSV
jgi:hypothetical protein